MKFAVTTRAKPVRRAHAASGFTLVELLVVIAIIAILSVVVILTLNPAELLRQSRDSNRVSDLSVLKSAIGLFTTDVATSSNAALGIYGALYGGVINLPIAQYVGANPGFGFAALSVTTSSQSINRSVNGSGWIPVNFNAISSGAPLGSLPIDPVNVGSNTYMYVASGTTFKLATRTESTKYGLNGSNDVVSTDGGNSNNTYEAGTNLQL